MSHSKILRAIPFGLRKLLNTSSSKTAFACFKHHLLCLEQCFSHDSDGCNVQLSPAKLEQFCNLLPLSDSLPFLNINVNIKNKICTTPSRIT
mmetsp:Transcript_40420/g.49033  ORF Transcript_40420/g.49033 Transcript_40420/m.49033 type:complete len:92 (-) Transcript_40420:852-1127(-)